MSAQPTLFQVRFKIKVPGSRCHPYEEFVVMGAASAMRATEIAAKEWYTSVRLDGDEAIQVECCVVPPGAFLHGYLLIAEEETGSNNEDSGL